MVWGVWLIELCHRVDEHAARQATGCTNHLVHTHTGCWQRNGKTVPFCSLSGETAATAASITSDCVYPITYIYFGLTNNYYKRKSNTKILTSWPQISLLCQITVLFIKPSCTVQYKASFCSLSVAHNPLNVASQYQT